LKQGIDFKLGYSPERINPGDKLHTLEKITKVVAGEDEETLELIATVYGQIIIPRGDVYTLENRLKQLIKNAELRYKMGTAARQRYEQEFTFDHMFTETYQTYENI
ncbi:MAG: hypothetical protein ACKO2Z_27030, partial [Sphaerospermopsis kisseleviana]